MDQNLFLTKAIYFDSSPRANWYVTWHQDTTINAKVKADVEGFSGWTTKEVVYGVCPTEEILKDTITVRIHLDDTNDQNGALKIIPGSHNKKLSDSEIQSITKNSIPFVCNVEMCGIHIMKPLMLHSSSKATSQKIGEFFTLNLIPVAMLCSWYKLSEHQLLFCPFQPLW